jgi:hypothetical protein
MNRETPEMVETMTASEVARILHTTPRAVIKSILNQTMPIGPAQAPEKEGENYNCTIIKERFWKYVKGELR